MSRFLSVNCQSDSHDGCPEMTPDRSSRCACSCHASSRSSYENRRALWIEFDQRHPHIFELLKQYALEAKAKGAKVGIRLLVERIRWDLAVKVERDPDEPKINDWFSSFWSRRLMAEVPALAGYFETRGDAPAPEAERQPEPRPYVTPEQESLL